MNATGLLGLLARGVQGIARSPDDHRTAIAELTLHRRNRPSQPVHCIYTLGMALTIQGTKHVLIGNKDLAYGPGQSLLTAIDLPVSYHVTRATAAEPYLGIMFKFNITGMSPVQFQKILRLQEARQLMLDQDMSAGQSSALVGYESVSQFSREYKRLFGTPPQKDIRSLRSE